MAWPRLPFTPATDEMLTTEPFFRETAGEFGMADYRTPGTPEVAKELLTLLDDVYLCPARVEYAHGNAQFVAGHHGLGVG